MSRRKDVALPGQLSLFLKEELEECCPLCWSAAPLTTCRRMYVVKRACMKCAQELRRYGWAIVG
jgi:hypothetical protein